MVKPLFGTSNTITPADVGPNTLEGMLSIDKLEDLLDEIGEGFHGEELDKQIAILDPEKTSFINQRVFIEWYYNLVNSEGGEDDNLLLDTEEREEQEEERAHALEAFQSVMADATMIQTMTVKCLYKRVMVIVMRKYQCRKK